MIYNAQFWMRDQYKARHIRIYIYTHIPICLFTYIHIYLNTYITTYIHIYIRTYVYRIVAILEQLWIKYYYIIFFFFTQFSQFSLSDSRHFQSKPFSCSLHVYFHHYWTMMVSDSYILSIYFNSMSFFTRNMFVLGMENAWSRWFSDQWNTNIEAIVDNKGV